MAQPLHFRRRSVVFRWLLSYISILIVPLILSGIVYLRTSATLQQEISRANDALLQQVKNDMDNKLGDMQRLSIQISLNPRVRTLLRDTQSALSAQDYNAMIQDFRVYRLANSSVSSFYIFLRERQAALTPSTMIVGSVYDDLLSNQFRILSGRALKEQLWNRGGQRFFPLGERVYGGLDKKLIAYRQPLPMDSTALPSAALLVLLDSGQLTKTLDNINWLDSGVVLVLDAQNNVLACTQEDFVLPGALRYANLTDEDSLFFYGGEAGERYAVAHAMSDVTDLKYLSILPDSLFWKKADDIRRFTLLAVLCSLALGGALAGLLTRRNYLPVRQLVNELASRAGMDLTPGQSEFGFMRSAIDAAFGSSHAVDEVKDRQLAHLRRSFIARLLKNNLESSIPVSEALSLYDIQFSSNRFCALLFFVKEIQGDVLKGARQDEYTLVRYILRNVFEELFNREHQAMMTTVDDLQVLLINVHDCDGFSAHCREAVELGSQFVRRHFGMVLSLSVSGVVEGLEELHNAYTEAYTTMEYNILLGREGLTDSSQLTCGMGGVNSSYYYYYPLKVEVQLTNFIKSGDYPQAKAIVNELLDRNFRQHTPPQLIARCFMFNLTSTMMKTAYEIAGIRGDELPDINDSIERLLVCPSVSEMEMELDKVLIRFCEYALERSGSRDFVQLAQDFIESNYGDSGLGVAQIAVHLDISPSYLSKRFRQSRGVSLPDAVSRVRVEAAKLLLTGGDSPLQDIALQCGFVNSNTLIRTFKKLEGITPGKYREINTAEECLV